MREKNSTGMRKYLPCIYAKRQATTTTVKEHWSVMRVALICVASPKRHAQLIKISMGESGSRKQLHVQTSCDSNLSALHNSGPRCKWKTGRSELRVNGNGQGECVRPVRISLDILGPPAAAEAWNTNCISTAIITQQLLLTRSLSLSLSFYYSAFDSISILKKFTFHLLCCGC